METDLIYKRNVVLPTLKRAESFAPPEFTQMYQWVNERIGEHLEYLPMGPNTPEGFSSPLARQAGIFSPDYRKFPSRGARSAKYAFSIHSGGSARYSDSDVLRRDDGTWILEYCAYKPMSKTRILTSFNDAMMNNFRDAVPVAVFVKKKSHGYENLGLAYIEQYDTISDSFTLHGPINHENELAGVFSLISLDEMSENDIQRLTNDEIGHDQTKRYGEIRYREKQSAFRQNVLAAYQNKCAITGIGIPQVLQAAHIDPYRGVQSQIIPNGIPLRADLHLLFDAHLISIQPEDLKIVVSDSISSTEYRQYHGKSLQKPASPNCAPSKHLLKMHYRQYEMKNHIHQT